MSTLVHGKVTSWRKEKPDSSCSQRGEREQLESERSWHDPGVMSAIGAKGTVEGSRERGRGGAGSKQTRPAGGSEKTQLPRSSRERKRNVSADGGRIPSKGRRGIINQRDQKF